MTNQPGRSILRAARRCLLATAVIAVAVCPRDAAAQLSATADDSARAIHLLNRATFGIRPGHVSALLSSGRDAWLERQLHPDRIRDTLEKSLASRYPLTALSMAETMERYAPPPRPRTPADTVMQGGAAPQKKATSPQRMLQELALAKLERSVGTERQLEEVMTDFWFNHFNVHFQKGADRYMVADYERSAIRPHVFGRFEDLLRATAKHPAMLFYLDNWQSVYVDSSRGRSTASRPGRGLNENYARELLELHTLGVDGGYTQRDVVEVARALTGWTFNQPAAKRGRGGSGDAISFQFRPALHDPGEKHVLGRRLPEGRGVEDGDDVLHILATQPSTARFIAAKLVEFFVTDRSDSVLTARIAAVFERTDGDLREVTRALFADPAFYTPSYMRGKVKTPFQLVTSTLRATDVRTAPAPRLLQTLRAMGHLPYMASAPTGYPAVSEDWVNSGAMLARMNFGLEYATSLQSMPAVRSGGQRSLDLPRDPASALDQVAARLLPGVNVTQLRRAILADVAANAADNPRAHHARMIGLVLGSPEFQHH